MAKLIIKDHGWNNMKKGWKSLHNSYTKVGFPAESEPGKSNKKVKGNKIATNMSEVATIAAFNEFGTSASKSKRSGGSKIHIPRPFMSTSFIENQTSLNSVQENQYNQVITGKKSVRQGLAFIGEFMVSKIKKKIVDIKTPPNSIATIQKKKSSNPLIDKSQMLNSVTHVEVIK